MPTGGRKVPVFPDAPDLTTPLCGDGVDGSLYLAIAF